MMFSPANFDVSVNPEDTNDDKHCKKRIISTEDATNDCSPKKPKLEESSQSQQSPAKHNHNVSLPHQSPKKRLDLSSLTCSRPQSSSNQKSKEKFIYGNYSKYYGYRNKGKDFHDIRLDVFETHEALFKDKVTLDIGCNSGFITLELAKRFPVKHITGIDIDRGLINQVNKYVTKQKKLHKNPSTGQCSGFPFNVSFLHANYVLRDDVLLEIEREQFDLILCLSVTKWIHLNFGDDGLKQAFRRMFLQLRAGGQLILEAQPFDNYGRRKKMTETIFSNYKSMQFFPKDFENYLLSSEVGFKSVSLMGVPDHCTAGFKRPIHIFNKG